MVEGGLGYGGRRDSIPGRELGQICPPEHVCIVYKDPSLPVYDEAFFESLLDTYMDAVYPMFPIITREEVRESIAQLHLRSHAAFVYALAAVVIGHTGVNTKDGNDRRTQVKYLVEQSLAYRGMLRPGIDIDIKFLMTNCLLSSSLVGVNDVVTAWAYLREAITIGAILGLHETKKLATFPLVERARRQRLYWMLYIHERFLSIHYYRPVVLTPMGVLPERDGVLPAGIHDGFTQLIKLFSLLDSNFINAYLDNTLQITQKWVEEKQEQLTSATDLESLTEMQKVDILITQLWMRMLVWQMAMSHLMLSSNNSTGSMSLLFPVEVARRLRALITGCSKRSIQVHGAGIVQKLFELAMGIADVIALIPSESLEENAGRIENFLWISQFLLEQPSLSATQKDALEKKLEVIREVTGIPVSPVGNCAVVPYAPSAASSTSINEQLHANLRNDDPWLSLSKTVADGVLDPTSRRDSLASEEGYEGPISWIANLSNVSGASKELLHNLEYSLPLWNDDGENAASATPQQRTRQI
jgi:hypothetical protein